MAEAAGGLIYDVEIGTGTGAGAASIPAVPIVPGEAGGASIPGFTIGSGIGSGAGIFLLLAFVPSNSLGGGSDEPLSFLPTAVLGGVADEPVAFIPSGSLGSGSDEPAAYIPFSLGAGSDDALSFIPTSVLGGGSDDAVVYRPPPLLRTDQLRAPLLAVLRSADMASTADQPIILGPTKYVIRKVIVTNASVTPSAAVGGIYTGLGKTGTAIVPVGQTYASLTSSAKFVETALAPSTATDAFAPGTVYLSLTTPHGVAATADFYIYGDGVEP